MSANGLMATGLASAANGAKNVHEPIKRTEMKRFTAEKIARQKRVLFQVIKGADK